MAKKKQKTAPQKRQALNSVEAENTLRAMLPTLEPVQPFTSTTVKPRTSLITMAAPKKGQTTPKMEKGGNPMMKVMTADEIDAVVAQIKPGTKFRIQFHNSSIDDLAYLLGMMKAGKVEVKEEMLLLAVMVSRNWELDKNRVFNLTAAEWDCDWFSGRIARRIEAIELK